MMCGGCSSQSQNPIAPHPFSVEPICDHTSMASSLSMAHFWGLKTDPEALALHRVSNVNGLSGFVVVMDVCPSPVTIAEEFFPLC